ncbi:MAG: HAD family hydrolase [Treponema sp.]|jgi:phosphoglycolate phosphatase|nr:HAD family hydrolase [Treponema sp.]
MKYRCVIFDLDGTLVDTLEDIAASMNRALEGRGFPPLGLEAYKKIVGWGIGRLAFNALPEQNRNEETVALVAGEARRFYTEKPLIHSRPYPGMADLAAELRRRKIRTAVLSNKPDSLCQTVVEGLFPRGTFDLVQGEISGLPRKPDPTIAWDMLVQLERTPRETIFMGDSEIDMETAIKAGSFPLGVDWGFRSRETLEKSGAARIIGKPEELLGML